MNRTTKIQVLAIILACIIDLILLFVGIYGFATKMDGWGYWFIASGILLFFILIVAFESEGETQKTDEDED